MPSDTYILWTERGLSCCAVRTPRGWEVSVQTADGPPFLRRFAQSHGDANNQGEFLRVLLDRSRAGVRPTRDRQPLVLIIADDPDDLFADEEMLKLDGFRTASASTLAEAHRLLCEVKPAAVLLDHDLPDGNGAPLCRELRGAAVGGAPVPIVLVTGFDPQRVAVVYGGGPDALLRKPCRAETLTAVLKLLAQRPKPARSQARAITPAGPLVRARCPVCGTADALVEATGAIHCQHCRQSAITAAADPIALGPATASTGS